MKKFVFITRVKNRRDFEDADFRRLIKVISELGPNKIYVICDTNEECSLKKARLNLLKNSDPVSPTSFNAALTEMKKDKIQVDYFLTVSKEVQASRGDIEKLFLELDQGTDLLVAGYKFEISLSPDDKKLAAQLNSELQAHYSNPFAIAFKAPMNTYALWNYNCFNRYVGKFDEITENKRAEKVSVNIDDVIYETDLKGMEDGLAIAEARSKDPDLNYLLVDKKIEWKILNDPEKVLNHRKKIARKNYVLRNFISQKNYKEDLI